MGDGGVRAVSIFGEKALVDDMEVVISELNKGEGGTEWPSIQQIVETVDKGEVQGKNRDRGF